MQCPGGPLLLLCAVTAASALRPWLESSLRHPPCATVTLTTTKILYRTVERPWCAPVRAPPLAAGGVERCPPGRPECPTLTTHGGFGSHGSLTAHGGGFDSLTVPSGGHGGYDSLTLSGGSHGSLTLPGGGFGSLTTHGSSHDSLTVPGGSHASLTVPGGSHASLTRPGGLTGHGGSLTLATGHPASLTAAGVHPTLSSVSFVSARPGSAWWTRPLSGGPGKPAVIISQFTRPPPPATVDPNRNFIVGRETIYF